MEDALPTNPPKPVTSVQAANPAGTDSLVANDPTSMYTQEVLRPKDKGLTASKILRLYVAPIITLCIFFALVIFLIVPTIGGIFERLDKISTTNENAASLDENIAALKDLATNIAPTNESLGLLNKLVPTGVTEVVNFQSRVKDLAKFDGLAVSDSTIGESVLSVEEGSSLSLAIVEIPSDFVLEGNLTQMKEFISSIKLLNDFVIVGELKLSRFEDTNGASLSIKDNWILNMRLIKYQFQTPDNVNQLAQKYATVPAVAKEDSTVMDYVHLLTKE